MKVDWARNVGTNGHPVSYLHERAVALLYDELKPRRNEGSPSRGATFRPPWRAEVRVRLADGTLSHNIRDGMAALGVADEWTNVGGIVPDLIMYGEDGKPIRIIEVIVSSPPTRYKRTQLNSLRKRGVDVVEVEVRTPGDLLTLCWTPVRGVSVAGRGKVLYASGSPPNIIADRDVGRLVKQIRLCSPRIRRELYAALKGLGGIDSLFPIQPDNPKASLVE